MPRSQYACSSANMPRTPASKTLCQNVRRKTLPSFPISPTVVTPTAMFCGEIIFPVTAPEELVAARRTSLR